MNAYLYFLMVKYCFCTNEMIKFVKAIATGLKVPSKHCIKLMRLSTMDELFSHGGFVIIVKEM